MMLYDYMLFSSETNRMDNTAVRWKDYYATSLICLTIAFLFADQNLLAPNLSMIAKEFGFNNQERDDK